jgi:alpha-tubulin suppressor-like RCC1 family protein
VSKRKAFLGLTVLAAIGLIGWQVLRSQKTTERIRSTASNREGNEPPPEKQSAGNPGAKQASVPPADVEKSSAASGAAAANRASLKVAGNDLPQLGKITEHSQIMIPLPGGGVATGVVQLVQTDARGLIRVGGRLTGDHLGSFSLVDDSGRLNGRVLMPQEKVAYVISSAGGGSATVQALPLGNVICYPFPLEPRPAAPMEGGSPGPQAAPPILSSRPAATAVLYLDFDGETVTDPDWPAYASDGVTITGPTIVAPASTLSNAQITEVWNRVKEDFWPFDIDVTTDLSRYNNAPVGRRMRVIITPNDAAFPGAGGVAYVGSFTLAGSPYFYFQSDHVGWVFNSSVDGIAEAISHELGHTLGLEHDGRNPPLAGFSSTDGSYYYGHGDPSSAVGWAPIMGAGYYQKLVQWSKGEYPAADNQQDDVAIISGQASFNFGPSFVYSNTVGYIADDAGNTRATATAIDVASGSANFTGMISSASDSDFYAFTVNATTALTFAATPPSTYPKQADLDVALELQDSSGNVLASSNPDTTLAASITTTLGAGTYYVKIQGAGRAGNPGAGDYGYSNYGSIGQYQLTITFPSPPTITTQPVSQTIQEGSPVTFTAAAAGFPAPTFQWQKDGVDISGATGSSYTIASVGAGSAGNYRVIATNSNGSATSNAAVLTVTLTAPAVTVQNALRQVLNPGQNLSLSVTATGTGPLSYQWWHNGRVLNGATGSSVNLNNITAQDGGYYFVLVTDSLGTRRSAVSFVIVAPAITHVTAWGSNSSGQLNVPAGLNDAVSVNANNNTSLAMRADGTVIGWGSNSGQLDIPAGLNNVVAVALGSSHGLALKADGTLAPWGAPSYGLGTTASTLTDVVAITAGFYFSAALKVDGTVVAWGDNGTSYNLTSVPAGLSNVVAIAGNNVHSLALKADGTVVAWGSNLNGRTNVPAGLSNVVAVATGSSHSLALKADGTVVAWGDNSYGQLNIPAGLGNVISIASGNVVSFAVKADGTMVSWGGSQSIPQSTVPFGLTSVLQASDGFAHALALCAGPRLAPSIATQPVSQTLGAGTTGSFSLMPAGTAPFTFKWQMAAAVANATWSDISDGYYHSGSDTAQLNLLVIPPWMNGIQLRCRVSNAVGTIMSDAVTLTVVNGPGAPVITAHPQPTTVASGTVANFNVTVTGASLSYQWQVYNTVSGMWSNAANLEISGGGGSNTYSGQNSPTLGINTVYAMNGAQYRCQVSNLGGVVESNSATLTVTPPPPVISVQPAGQFVAIGAPINLTVVASGQGSLSYQWRKNGADIGGATSVSYNIASAQLSDAGNYSVVVSDSAGSVTSNAAAVVVVTPPVINTQPAAQTVNAGQAASFSVTATSAAPLSYVWRKNGTPIGGATAATYTIASTQTADAADYSVVVTNVAGSVTSNTATLTVNPLATPVFTTQPVGQSAGVGVTVQFTVAATGAPAPAYQWQVLRATGGTWGNTVDGAGYSGSQTATLSVVGSQMANNGDQYRCVASNVAGSATSNPATHTVVEGPVITGHPQSQTGLLGLILQFSVTATGVPAPTYQWQRRPVGTGVWADLPDGIYVTGSTTPTLTVTFGAGWTDQDQVRCVVSNNLGSATSNAATLSWPQQAGVVRVAGGAGHTVLIRSDGVLYTTGANGFGQLGRGNTTNVNFGSWVDGPEMGNLYGHIIDVAAGANHSFYLKSDATLWAMGRNANGQLGTGDAANRLSPVQVAAGVAAAAPGTSHSLYIKQDGTLWATGDNTYGQLGDGTNTPTLVPKQVATHVVAAASAFVHSAFLKSDGTLWSMGHNGLGELGDGSPFNRNVPVQTATGVVALSARGYHTLFIKTNGTLWVVGYNNVGQLGDGTLDTRATPVQVATNVMAVAGGMFHSLFLKTDGTLWAMGDNTYGQLGTGDTTARSTPVQVATGVIAVAAGENHSAYITTDGSYWAMGRGDSGQLGDQANQNRSSPWRVMQGYVPLPAPPTAVTASDAAHPDRIAVSWTGGLSSGYYELWRGTTNMPAAATQLSARVPTPYYEDLSATPNQAYYYWIKGVNAAGTGAFSAGDAGTAGSATPPVVTTPPQSQTVNVGANVTFSVIASGTAPFTYQWRKGTNPIGSATGASYTITNVASTDAGSYDVVVTNGAGSVTSAAAVLTVNKLAQAITFAPPADLAYTPLPFELVATSDSGLPVAFSIVSGPATLDDNELTLTGVGTVTVRAAQGGNATYAVATNVDRSFVVSKAVATVTLGDLAATYDGIAKSATATTDPAGLNVTFTYEGSATPPTNAGSYAVVGTIAEANYQGTASGTLVIAKAAATVTLGSLTATYDGTAKSATATTSPAGLNVTFAYDGSATVPTNAGSYAVIGTITEANYEGTASGTLVIAKAVATLTLGNLTATYNGAAKSATATTNPANLTVAFTYNGSATPPTNAGGYTVVGTIAEANYQGTASGTLVIAKAVATVTLGNLTPTYDGTAKSATATTTPAGLTVNLSYDGSPTAPTNAGSYAVVGTVNEANYQGTANGTLVIAKADQTISFTGPASQPFSLVPITLGATATSGLPVTFSVASGPATVSGTTLTLTSSGTVTVRATQAGDANRNAAPEIDQSFTVTANLASWRLGKFTAGELLDANISGPNADPDHDGFVNLLEYALGLEPKSASTTGLPQVGTEGSDWAYTYTRPADRTDVTFVVEMSTNLTDWSAAGVTHVLVSSSGGNETWRAKYPLVSAANCYFRLKVTGQ